MSHDIIKNAISAVIALGISAATAGSLGANATPQDNKAGQDMLKAPPIANMEKCFGVVKAGMNDCGNKNHNCSGEAKNDRSPDDWLFMPTGLCKRIAGGSTDIPKDS